MEHSTRGAGGERAVGASRSCPSFAFVTDTTSQLLAYRFPLCFVSFHLFHPRSSLSDPLGQPPSFPPTKCHSIGRDPLRKAKYRFIDSRPPFLKAFLMEPILLLLLLFLLLVAAATSSASPPPPTCSTRCLDCYWFYDYRDFTIARVPDFRKDRRTMAIKPVFLAARSSQRGQFEAEWPRRATPTVMDWSLRDSWFRNYGLFLPF